MRIKRKHWTALFLFTAVFSLLLLSSGISSTEMSTEWNLFDLDGAENGRGTGDSMNDLLGRLPTIPDTVLQILYLTGLIIVPILLIFAIFSPETRQMILQEIKRAIPFAVWILAFGYLLGRIQFQQTRATQNGPAMPGLPDWIRNPPLLVTLGMGMVLVGGVVLLIWLVWQRLKPRHPLERLAFEAQTTIDELESGVDFTNAIIECYVRMCQVIRRERHIVRREGMTPREFARRLEHFGLAGVQVQQLTRLFEKVRYGNDLPTEKEKREAISCLEAIVYAAGKPGDRIATAKSIIANGGSG